MTLIKENRLVPAEDIFQVLEQMDSILSWAQQNNSRSGYFAALYRKVSLKVKTQLEQGAFEDNERMEKILTVFANRYFEAFNHFLNQTQGSRSWQIAFEAAHDKRYTVLQHLLAGINAHINLDLAIATVQVAGSEELETLQNDFYKINEILAAMLDEVTSALEQVWKPLAFLDRLAGMHDEWFINFSMRKARNFAWKNAGKLHTLHKTEQEAHIQRMDQTAHFIGQRLLSPPLQLKIVLFLIRKCERGSIQEIIRVLSK